MKGLFALPPGVDFAAELLRGLETRNPGPVALARAEVWVNTARTRRRLQEVFDEGPARLLPKIRLVTELGPLVADAVAPGLSPLARRLELRQLVARLIEAEPDIAARSSAYDLADSLALLFVEMADEGVGIETLSALDIADASGHWQRSLKFLEIAHQIAGRPDASSQQRQVVEALMARWMDKAPDRPVVLAGSTGSRGPVGLLMRHLISSGQGAVVLPGFDFHMREAEWAALGAAEGAEDHPQYRYYRLFSDLGLEPGQIERWTDAEPASPRRNRLMSLALRPAPVTDSWMRDGPELGPLGPTCETMTLIEAPNPRDEALAIALRLRRAAEEGQRAALITPDRTLSRRVRAALDRWRIEPDDSAGTPLDATAPGRLMLMVARMMGRPAAARDLVPLLAHPLVCAGEGRGAHLRMARSLDIHLRKSFAVEVSGAHVAEWGDEEREGWAAWLSGFLGALQEHPGADLAKLIEAHISLCERLVSGPGASVGTALWSGAEGEEAARFIAGLRASAEHGGALTAADYADLIGSLMAQSQVRSAVTPHPSIMIWGTLEARVQAVDLAILGGLNESSWPQHSGADPWLSRIMRRDAGLLSPERRIGLSAHDFQSAAGAAELVLSRAMRDDDAMTVPARWLNRLTNLLAGLPGQGGGTALAAMQERGQVWLALARRLEADCIPVPPEPRPSVVVPVAARPHRLSVTQIQALLRDPYAIYARHVLGLQALPALGQGADARLRGTLLHSIFERFLRAAIRAPDRLTAHDLMDTAKEVLAPLSDRPALRTRWLAGLARLAEPFVADERLRWQQAAPAWFEVRGVLDLTLPDGSGFSLSGIADRLDIGPDDQAALYDYKSGQIPSPAEQAAFDKQLYLLALMASEGAFRDARDEPLPRVAVSRAGYIGIGSRIQSKTTEIDTDILADFRAGFIELLAAYRVPEQGYASRAMPKHVASRGDYDRLARHGEWDDSAAVVPVRVGGA